MDLLTEKIFPRSPKKKNDTKTFQHLPIIINTGVVKMIKKITQKKMPEKSIKTLRRAERRS